MSVSLDKTPAVILDILDEKDVAFLTAMRQAVIDKGADYIYEQRVVLFEEGGQDYACDYLRGGVPSCIVGHGIINANIMDASHLALYEGTAAYEVLEKNASGGLHYDVIQAANKMQGEQDTGTPWGEAYNHGIAYLASLHWDVEALRL